eukprot:9047450-Lingulodinium_polyedra.AAC.1
MAWNLASRFVATAVVASATPMSLQRDRRRHVTNVYHFRNTHLRNWIAAQLCPQRRWNNAAPFFPMASAPRPALREQGT